MMPGWEQCVEMLSVDFRADSSNVCSRKEILFPTNEIPECTQDEIRCTSLETSWEACER